MSDDGRAQRSKREKSHKRSKSAAAFSVITRKGRRSKNRDTDSYQTDMSSFRDSQSAISSKSSSRNAPLVDSATTSDDKASMPTSPEPKGSIEQTVQAYRLFEALRAGDTASISKTLRSPNAPETILHLAVQCASLQVVEFILSTTTSIPDGGNGNVPFLDINARDPQTGNTALHLAAQLGRSEMVGVLLSQPAINDSLPNYSGKLPLDLARSPAIYERLSVARAVFIEEATERLISLINERNYPEIERLLDQERVRASLDLNTIEVAADTSPKSSSQSINKSKDKNGTFEQGGGSTLLHDAARKKDTKLIQILLLHGADPFRRDRKGKLPQDVTKDEKTRAVLKKSPARVVAERGIEERAVLGNPNTMLIPPRAASGVSSSTSLPSVAAPAQGKESREMKGYLKKWTNYTGGWKLRWFVLEDGVLSYYKNQEDVASACRGAINMRIARLHMDPADKTKFEIQGKSSVKYHLKANHAIEAKRWYWSLNNAIQWAKDEAKEEELRKRGEQERYGRIKEQQRAAQYDSDIASKRLSKAGSIAASSTRAASARSKADSENAGNESDYYEVSASGNVALAAIDGSGEDDEGEDSDDTQPEPPSAEALALVANSARVQLDLLSQVCLALKYEKQTKPDLKLSDPTVSEILASYDSATSSLQELLGDVLRISRERDNYWRKALDKEINLRNIWEENMMRLAQEQERLESKMGHAREKQKKTKRALKTVLREGVVATPPINEDGLAKPLSEALESVRLHEDGTAKIRRKSSVSGKKLPVELELSESESDDDEDDEFFDAVDAGEVEVLPELPTSPNPVLEKEKDSSAVVKVEEKAVEIKSSFKGYEDPPRFKLAKDTDDRPKISLWGILKSMIGKDMTKMTLPVSFNECTSLLQRVAEDMEYTELLDMAAERTDSTERMVYVAAFAASEYSSTINRIAKPFNPLLGETYEYCRPDKGYRFFVEQVSHHPPIGAAWAESPKWDYWGESAVKSKFYGKSFDINPLGTWFLKLRPISGEEELYTWKKVTTSVVGIVTGSPVVDNYGRMEITNHNTGDVCHLDFKPRGWRAANAYEVKGRVFDNTGTQRWSIGGRWNDKIYARLSPGYDAEISPPTGNASIGSGKAGGPNAAFLVWESHPRPPAPFNLTPFAISLNALPPRLKPHLCPTDTRLRPDQRAMEDGEYDFAADEKHRLEEKQRAKRREREMKGEEWHPRWFVKRKCEVTGEEYWHFDGEYWKMREAVSEGKGEWQNVDSIF